MSNLGLLEGDKGLYLTSLQRLFSNEDTPRCKLKTQLACKQRDIWNSTLSPPFNIHGLEEKCRLIVISSFLTILDPAFKSWGRVKWGRTGFLNERQLNEPIKR